MKQLVKGLGLAALVALPAAAQDQPRARVAQGELSGMRERGTNAFLNVPFAAAPVGDLRWKAPAPPPAWSGARDASKPGPACMQPDAKPLGPWSMEYLIGPPYSEDCLNLNVWTTAKPGAGQAVVLFVPGGGFNAGGANVPVYNGANMAKSGIVVVTMNYRLTAAGFMTHPELTREAGHSGNYGLMDVIAALSWIKANIAAFGGDPAKVTVMGQSAGAGAINALLRSPEAAGLFRAAILNSGVRQRTALQTSAERETAGVEWAAAKGATTLAQMRALPSSALVPTGNDFRFRPTMDSHVVPSANAPILHDVPIMTGWNAGEGTTPQGKLMNQPISRAEFEAWAGADAKDLLALYPSGDDATSAMHAAGHDSLMMGTVAWAIARGGKAPLYLFDFEHVMPGAQALTHGSYHTSELPYVFDTLHTLKRPWTIDEFVAGVMQTYFVRFIMTGDPNNPHLPHWSAFDPAKNEVMAISNSTGMRPVTAPAKAAYFRRVNAKP
ncbi:MAG: carboxylesterase family protein [Pseudomonadota bacterium]